jgi:peptide/nickel transport system substrate-binding protein
LIRAGYDELEHRRTTGLYIEEATMENRFSVKDLIVCSMLSAVLVIAFIAMYQTDRQWDRVVKLQATLDLQTQDMQELKRSVNELSQRPAGPAAVAPHNDTTPPPTTSATDSTSTTTPKIDAFTRLREARAKPDYAQGDWIVDAFGANVARITPLITGDAYGGAIQNHVVESLANRDAVTLEYVPLIAKSWSIDDRSPAWQAYVDKRLAVPLTEAEVLKEDDYPKEAEKQKAYVADRLKEGRRIPDVANEADCPAATVITFQMRNDVKFSDSTPLTSADILFTYELILNDKIDAPRDREAIKDLVKNITAKGPYEVSFFFKKPYFESFGVAAGFGILPKHFYSQFTPQQINETPGLLLGSGPYTMEDPKTWTPGKLLVLYRNPRYWGVPPAFDRVIYREINLDAARLTLFRNREVDVFPAQPEQYVKMIKDEELLKRTKHYEYERVTGGYGFIAWNQQRKSTDAGAAPGATKATAFADARVRRAMTMMIDRQRLFDEILLGYGIPISGPFNRLSRQYDQAVKPWPYDIAAAKSLLKEAGFSEDAGTGVIKDKDGKQFRFTVTYPSGTGFWDRVLLSLKDSLTKAGVVMELEPLEWSIFDSRIKARDFDALCMAWGGGIESDPWQMFHSSQIKNQADNFTSYSNPKFDALCDEARRTVDEEKRMPLWQQVHKILHEDQPYTFLYSRKSLMFIDDRIQNVQRTKVGLNERDEWYVPKNLQLRGKQ